MAFLREYQMKGDPFLGIPVGLAFGAVKKGIGKLLHHGKPTGALAQQVKEAIGGGAAQIGRAAERFPGGKKGALLAGGAAAAGLGLGAGGAELMGMRGMGRRRYRRMNPTNVRALRRSMRRVKSFVHIAKQAVHFTHTVRMKKGRIAMHRKRRVA